MFDVFIQSLDGRTVARVRPGTTVNQLLSDPEFQDTIDGVLKPPRNASLRIVCGARLTAPGETLRPLQTYVLLPIRKHLKPNLKEESSSDLPPTLTDINNAIAEVCGGRVPTPVHRAQEVPTPVGFNPLHTLEAIVHGQFDPEDLLSGEGGEDMRYLLDFTSDRRLSPQDLMQAFGTDDSMGIIQALATGVLMRQAVDSLEQDEGSSGNAMMSQGLFNVQGLMSMRAQMLPDEADEVRLLSLVEMGFHPGLSENALLLNGNSLEAAVEWLTNREGDTEAALASSNTLLAVSRENFHRGVEIDLGSYYHSDDNYDEEDDDEEYEEEEYDEDEDDGDWETDSGQNVDDHS